MNTNLKSKWHRLSLGYKILSILAVFLLIGLSTRSLVLAVAAWIIIIYFAVKFLTDFEIL